MTISCHSSVPRERGLVLLFCQGYISGSCAFQHGETQMQTQAHQLALTKATMLSIPRSSWTKKVMTPPETEIRNLGRGWRIKHLGNQAFQHRLALRTTGEVLIVGVTSPWTLASVISGPHCEKCRANFRRPERLCSSAMATTGIACTAREGDHVLTILSHHNASDPRIGSQTVALRELYSKFYVLRVNLCRRIGAGNR